MPENPQLNDILEKAELAYHQGNYAEAIGFWEQALAVDPENSRAQEGIRMSKLLVEAGGTVADGVLAQVISEKEGNPADVPPAEDYGRIKAQFEHGDLEGAIARCRIFLNHHPDHPEAASLLQMMEQNLNSEKAVRDHVARGYEHLQAGNAEAAMRECQEALILNGSHPAALELHRRVSRSPSPPADASPGGKTMTAEPPLEVLPVDPAEAVPASPAGSSPGPPPAAAPGNTGSTQPVTPVGQGNSPPAAEADEPPLAMPPSTESRQGTPEASPESSEPVGPPGSKHPLPPAGGAAAAGESEADRDLEMIGEGGTQYGQWVDEFASLDMDAAEESVGYQAPSKTAPPAGAADDGNPAGFNPTTGEFEMPADVESIPLVSRTETAAPDPASPTEGRPGTHTSLPVDGGAEAVPEPGPPPPRPARRAKVARPLATDSYSSTRRSSSGLGIFLVVLFMGVAAAGAWFYMRGNGFSIGRGGGSEDPAPAVGSSGGETPPTGSDPVPDAPAPPEPAPDGGAGSPSQTPSDPAEPQPPEPSPVMSPAERSRQVAALIRSGRELHRQGNHESALEKLKKAQALDPVNFELKELMDEVQLKLEAERKGQKEVEAVRQAFNDMDYANALRRLYRLPGGAEVEPNRTYIRNSWHNWGIQLLQAGNCREASERFDEVLSIRPGDPDALKLQDIAQRYGRKAKDGFFYNYVESLELKPLEAR